MSDLTHSPGQSVPVDSCTTTDIVVDGNWTAMPAFAGIPYCFRYRFSPQYLKQNEGQGARVPLVSDRVQLRKFMVGFTKTQHFKVEVTPEISGTTYTYPVGDDSLTLDSETLNLQDDDLNVPVMAENNKVQIDLVNCSPFPSNFLTGAFTGEYAPKARRIG